MTLTSGMQTELAKPAVVMFVAVEIVLPGATVRLLLGGGSVTFSSKTFTAKDATYGALGAVGTYADGIDEQAPRLSITLLQTSNVGMAAMAAPGAQGSQVSIWVGCIVPTTGAVVADPDLAFIGELDVATQKVGMNARALEVTVVSIFERFFDQDEGSRLNDGFHRQLWTGETGLEFVTQVQRQLPWGSDAPRPSLITNVPQGGFPGLGGNFNFVLPG